MANHDQNVTVGSTPTDTIGPRSRSRLSPRYVLVLLKWRKNRSIFKARRVFSFNIVQSDSFLCQPTDEHNREAFACESDHSRLATIIVDVPLAVENLPVVWMAYKNLWRLHSACLLRFALLVWVRQWVSSFSHFFSIWLQMPYRLQASLDSLLCWSLICKATTSAIESLPFPCVHRAFNANRQSEASIRQVLQIGESFLCDMISYVDNCGNQLVHRRIDHKSEETIFFLSIQNIAD